MTSVTPAMIIITPTINTLTAVASATLPSAMNPATR